jgi:F-type H+-transporting ATPase subunit epsilon
MMPFKLKIVTPDGLIFDGEAEKLIVRTSGGDVCILARHMDYVAPLGMGMAIVEANGKRRTAACIGGMLSVSGGECTLVPTTFEWSDKIDLQRAEASYNRADKILKSGTATDTEIALAQARLHRALVRKSVVSFK